MAEPGTISESRICAVCGKRKLSLFDTLAGRTHDRCQCKNNKTPVKQSASNLAPTPRLTKAPVELRLGTKDRDASNRSAQEETQDQLPDIGMVSLNPEHEDEMVAAKLKLPEPDVLEPGTRLGGRYKVESLLGVGGMGAVYKVTHEFMGRTFALKILHRDVLANDQVLARFDREAKASIALSHPNLVSVADYGVTAEGAPFLVMEFIDGKSLGAELETVGRFRPKRLIKLFKQICAGLEAAHQRGIIHRDMKPNNIMLSTDKHGKELVKIVDFGISKIVDPKHAETALTQTGEIFGSPLYMSPEQCRGMQVDPRSDIYSLGCIMYECLTGEPPLMGDNPVLTILKHLHDEPVALTEKDFPDLPKGLNKILSTCLNKEPDQRYQTVTELRADLERIESGEDPKAARGSVAKEESYWRNLSIFTVRSSIVGVALAFILSVLVTLTHLNMLAGTTPTWLRPAASEQIVPIWIKTLNDGIRHEEDDRVSAEVVMKHALDQAVQGKASLADLAQINYVIGRINKSDDKEEARQFFKTARRQAAACKDKVLEAKCNEGLAFTIFSGEGSNDIDSPIAAKVIPLLEKAVALRTEAADADARALSTDYRKLGAMYAAVGDDDQSTKALDQVHQLASDRERAWNEVLAFQLEAESALKKKDFHRMEEKFNLALERGKECVSDSRHLREIAQEYLDGLAKENKADGPLAAQVKRDYLTGSLPEDNEKEE